MQFFITFLEGILSFLSPCMLPMLPVYLSYFAGAADGAEDSREEHRRTTLVNALFFVAGFTVVYLVLALAALYSAIRYIRRHPMTPPVIAMPDDDEEGREF